MTVEIDWVCELCHRTVTGDLPDGWELVLQSAICPECMDKVQAQHLPLMNLPGGHFAHGATDPRAHKVDCPRTLSFRMDGLLIPLDAAERFLDALRDLKPESTEHDDEQS